MKYQAVIFDMDGVIFDSERISFLCWKDLSVKYGFSEDFDENYNKVIGTNRPFFHGYFKSCYGAKLPFEEYEKEKQHLVRERYSGGRMPKKPGVEELLAYLKNENVFTALASSTFTDIVSPLLVENGLMPFFRFIIGGEMVTRSKPDPEIFLKAAEAAGVSPSRCAVIEDSYNGIRAAEAAGMFPIMVPDMLPPTDEMKEKAGIILPDLLSVKDFLYQTEG